MENNQKKFVTIFPTYRDFYFYKDPGQVPYRFQKLGYTSEIVCYNNDDSYKITSKHLRLRVFKNSRLNKRLNLSFILYLLKNARKIEILNVFHLKWKSLLFAFFYKKINPMGFVYLKMDNCVYSGVYPWEELFDPTKKASKIFYTPDSSFKKCVKDYLIKKYFVNVVDLWSIEDSGSRDYYVKHYKFFQDKLITVYNGHPVDIEGVKDIKSFNQKENMILTVGRLGTYPKATEVVLEAFKSISKYCDWNLHLAGSIEEEFQKYISKYFAENPELKDRVVFHGHLEKGALYDLYNRSKIFCLPSRYEGFGCVFCEAMYFKNAIVTTYYVSPRDLIKDNMGLLVEKDDVEGLANAMQYLTDNPYKTEEFGEKAHQFAKEELNWDGIILNLYETIENKRNYKE